MRARTVGGTVALALALGACVESIDAARRNATARNHGAYERALARASAGVEGEVFVPYQRPIASVQHGDELPRSAAILDGAIEGEALYELPDDGGLALGGVDCALGSVCGCDVPNEYRFVRAPDGDVTVIRLRPLVTVRTVRVTSCGYGCGQPAPVEPIARGLGVRDASRIVMVDAIYPYELVQETCDHPTPRP